jgi:predicted transcriptional regulator
MKLNKNDEKVVAALKDTKELTLADLTEKTGIPSKKVFKSLKKLFEHEMIDSAARKYRLLTDKPPVKGKDEEEAPAEEE